MMKRNLIAILMMTLLWRPDAGLRHLIQPQLRQLRQKRPRQQQLRREQARQRQHRLHLRKQKQKRK